MNKYPILNAEVAFRQILLPSPNNSELMSAFEIEHPYPPTKVMWSPQSFGNSVEYLATTADYLRIWTVTDSSLERHATISTVQCIVPR
jgi:DDB1- and CUL4-associated factor 7